MRRPASFQRAALMIFRPPDRMVGPWFQTASGRFGGRVGRGWAWLLAADVCAFAQDRSVLFEGMARRIHGRQGEAVCRCGTGFQHGKKPFYGWVVVVACGLVYLLLGSFALNAGQIGIPVMVTQPDIMMDRTLVGLGFTVFILFQGLLAPLIGMLVSKKGARVSMMLSAILLIVGGILFAQFGGSSTIAYFLIFGVLLSVSGAMGSQVPCRPPSACGSSRSAAWPWPS